MVAKRRNVPDPLRRALRLAISVAISGATGFALLEPFGGWHSRWGSQTMMGTKWAAITCVVCNAPVIAKTTEVALERVLGTVAGGMLGYGLALFNDLLPFLDQPFFTVGALMVVAFSSILLGYKLRLDYSGRLFIMTFILVVMAAPRTADAMAVAVTRISGIVFGVILTMIMSVIVFPKSASHQATDSLQGGLAALARLNAVAWGDEQQKCLRSSPRAGGAASGPLRIPSIGDGITDRVTREHEAFPTPREQLLMDSEGGDTCCDEVLSEVYAKLSACQDFTVMSKSETYVFTTRGRWCFFPAFKCFPWRTALPNAEMFAVAAASRKVARLLWCLHTSLPQGAEDMVALARYHGATRFLAGLGASCQVYLENLAECFPNQGALDTNQLYTFIEGVETLITASHKATCDSQILLRASWLAEHSVHSVSDLEDGLVPEGLWPSPVPNGVGHLHADGADGEVAITIKPASLDSHVPIPDPGKRKHHRSASGNMAFICASDGSVTKVSGGSFRAVENGYRLHQPSESARFSPVSELLPEGSQTDAVLSEAAAANAEAEPGDFTDLVDSKQGYISQVRWQATQFLLRRLVSELTALNVAFIRLSAMLPPTRWESRLQKRQKHAQGELGEPLLADSQA